jgi:preprotein translocase subunit YajC
LEQQQLLSKMKSGDRVVTSSGIVGTIIAVKDKTVTVRTAGDTKLEFTKGSVVEITATGSDSSEA